MAVFLCAAEFLSHYFAAVSPALFWQWNQTLYVVLLVIMAGYYEHSSFADVPMLQFPILFLGDTLTTFPQLMQRYYFFSLLQLLVTHPDSICPLSFRSMVGHYISMLSKNLVFLSTITSVGTLIALLGTVMGMIRSFSALGEEGGAGAAGKLAVGISEALYNTALGIGTSACALIMYNVFTTRIDSITYGIDESGFTLTQSFASLYK